MSVVLIIVAAVASPASDLDSLIQQANQHFEDKDYDKALELYTDLSHRGYESASLFFNIGNCYFKKGELGYAVLFYLRAKRLDPNDDDINANLDFARQFMPTQMEGVEINPVTQFFGMLTAPFTLDILAWLSSIMFIILILFLSAFIYFQLNGLGTKLIIYFLLGLFVISAGLTTYKYRHEYMTRRGVIVTDEAKVFSAPTADGDLEFVGAFGLTFDIGREADDYYLVIFDNKRKGWIKKEFVEII